MCDVVEVRSVMVCGRTSQIEEDSDFEGKKIVKKKNGGRGSTKDLTAFWIRLLKNNRKWLFSVFCSAGF